MAKDTDTSENKNMSFLGHLEELRWRLVRSAAVILVFATVIFIFTEEIVDYVMLAHTRTDFITYQLFGQLGEYLGMGDNMYAGEIPVEFMATKMTEQFMTQIMMCIIGGVIVAFPYFFVEVWMFIRPALKEKERSAATGVIFFGSLLFFFGIFFGYFLVVPLTVQFFSNWKIHESVDNLWAVNSYLSTVTITTFITGLFFQMPIFVYILSKIGVISSALLKKFRRHAIIILLILSAIITPPDVISQVLLTIPLIGLYEISILIAKRMEKRREKAEAA